MRATLALLLVFALGASAQESDRPLQPPSLIPEAQPAPVVASERPKPSATPVVLTIVFTGLTVGAGAAALVLTSQSGASTQQARDAVYQDDAQRFLDQASNSASTANVLWGAAGALALGAIIAAIAWATEWSAGSSAEPAPAANPSATP